MKIAVTYEDGNVFQHFGHTAFFKIYQVEDNRVVSAQVVATEGAGHGALAGFLTSHGVNVLICGGIGGGAQAALRQAGITFYGGVQGKADSAVEDLMAGRLTFDPQVHCDHHGSHGEGDHDCGSHGTCGHGDHGCHA